jgi:hypothetical protein
MLGESFVNWYTLRSSQQNALVREREVVVEARVVDYDREEVIPRVGRSTCACQQFRMIGAGGARTS